MKQDNQTAKADEGKLQISLVPTQIIRDIAEVRMYGNQKAGKQSGLEDTLTRFCGIHLIFWKTR